MYGRGLGLLTPAPTNVARQSRQIRGAEAASLIELFILCGTILTPG